MKLLLKELDFWRIEYSILKVEEQLEDLFALVPEGIHKKGLHEWRKIGVLNLHKYYNIDDDFNYAVKLGLVNQGTGEISDYRGQINRKN